MAEGCAYEVRRGGEAIDAARLGQLRKVAVAPFRYWHDWTGLFRAIYREAAVKAPPGRKADPMEATFLPEDALARRGYVIVPWPEAAGDLPERPGERLSRVRARLPALRAAGAEGILLATGESRCESRDLCSAEVKILLIDGGDGRVVWRGYGRAVTLFSQGDEMQAAVRGAMCGIPMNRERR